MTTNQTQTSKTLPKAPEYSAWGRGEKFVRTLIEQLEKGA